MSVIYDKHAVWIQQRDFPLNLLGFFFEGVPLLLADNIELSKISLHKDVVLAL